MTESPRNDQFIPGETAIVPSDVVMGVEPDTCVAFHSGGFQQASLESRNDWALARSIASGEIAMPEVLPAELWDMVQGARKLKK